VLANLCVAGPVEQCGAVEPVAGAAGLHLAEARVVVVGHDHTLEADPHPGGQWTIFDSGSSIRSVAPAPFRSGISTLIWSFATTVSTA